MAGDKADAWLAQNVRARMVGLSAKTLERIHRDDSRRQVERDVAGDLLRELGEEPLAVDERPAEARREYEDERAMEAGGQSDGLSVGPDLSDAANAAVEPEGLTERDLEALAGERDQDGPLGAFLEKLMHLDPVSLQMAERALNRRGRLLFPAEAEMRNALEYCRKKHEDEAARHAAVERRAAARKAAREPGGDAKGFPQPWGIPRDGGVIEPGAMQFDGAGGEPKPTRIAISANAELAQQFAATMTAAGFPCSAQKCHRIAGIPGDQKDAWVVNYRDDETEVGMVAVWWGRKHFKAYLEIVGGSHLTDETAAAFTGFLTEARKAVANG